MPGVGLGFSNFGAMVGDKPCYSKRRDSLRRHSPEFQHRLS